MCLDYTSPVFFWTNIEMSLGVISACLPIYRPIWLLFKGKPVTAKKSYKMGSYSRFASSRDVSSSRPGKDHLLEEDKATSNWGPGVRTVVETGTPGARDHLDRNVIEVERNIVTNEQPQRFD